MKVADCANYDKNNPHVFPWGHVENTDLANIGSNISNHIDHYLRHRKNYEKIDGLKLALNLIAERAEI